MSKTPSQWCDLAAELLRKGETSEALYNFDEAINIDPNFGRAYYEKGVALGGLGREIEAVELLKKSLSLGYDNAENHFNVGKYLKFLERYEEAVECYEHAIQDDPQRVESYKNGGSCLVMVDRAQDAVTSFAKAIELNPTDYEVYSFIGPILEYLGKKDEAMKYYDKCLSKSPKNFGANYRKGCLLWQEGKHQESLKYLEVAFSINNLHPGVCYHVGSAYAALGNKDKSKEFFSMADQMEPELGLDYCHRGQCYYLLGNKIKAIEDFAKGQDLLERDTTTMLLPAYVNGIRKVLMNLPVSDKVVEKTAAAVNQPPEDPTKKDEFENLKKLQEKLDKAHNQMVSKLHQKEGLEGFNEFLEIRKQLVELQTSLEIKFVDTTPEKTADDWCQEGNNIKKDKKEEAISCYNKALTINPEFGRAYFCKALVAAELGKKSQSVEYYKKAILYNYSYKVNAYYNMGISLNDICRREESIVAYTKALEIDPKRADALSNRGNSLMMLGRPAEAVESYAKALELDPADYPTYSDIGPLLEDLGRKDEAIKYYDTCLSKAPTNFRANYSKGCFFFREKKYEDSIKHLEVALQQNNNHPGTNYFLGSCYLALGDKDKAMTYFNKADNMKPSFSVQYCNRGQCYFAIDQKEKGLADFKKARELLESDKTTMLLPTFINFMKSAIRTVLEAEDVAKQTEEKIKKLDQKNPAVQKFLMNIKKLQDNQNQLQNKVVGGFGQVKADEAKKDVNELEKLKEEFKKQFEDMQREVGQLKNQVSNVEADVKKIKNRLEELKEELDNKMDDFNKKLDKELDKQNLSSEDKDKLKGYYSAFVGTFTSIYITSQVVDSGQVKLDAGTGTGTVLSFLASFAPFVGNNLSSTILSLDEFLQSQQMIKNARRMKGIASDTVALSKILGQAGYDIVMDKNKQQAVLNTTAEDLRQVSGSLLKKLRTICDNLSDNLDVYLYTELYKTPAQRVGNNDANSLVEKWMGDEIDPYDVEKQFVDHILRALSEKPAEPLTATSPDKNAGNNNVELTMEQRGSECKCNMF